MIVLISCVKSKRNTRSAAKDLYVSTLFKEMRGFAERQGGPWRILSANYGLLNPDDLVEPYELTLKKMGKAHKAEWADKVWGRLQTQLKPNSMVVILAGKEYRELLVDRLTLAGHNVEVPMQGLSFGRQLSWLQNEGMHWHPIGHER